MPWFGNPWPDEYPRAPVCEDDNERIATPVGEECFQCGTLILEGDKGSTARLMEFSPEGVMIGRQGYIHAECSLRAVIGNWNHLSGLCIEPGDCLHLDKKTYREQALEVWQKVVIEGALQ